MFWALTSGLGAQDLKSQGLGFRIWEFPKIRGTLFWGPCNKDRPILGTTLGSPIFGNCHFRDLKAQIGLGFRV